MKIMITGVSGFIGRSLALRLLSDNHEVTGLDVLSHNCDKLFNFDNFKLIKCDIADEESLIDVNWSEFESVFHLAAAGVKAINRDWSKCCRVNVLGTANLLKMLSRIKSTLKPLLIYPRTFYEDHIKKFPILNNNPYISTKTAATACVNIYSEEENSRVCMIKLFQVYGPGDDPDNVLNYAVRCMLNNKKAEFGSGKGKRDWIYLSDFIEALVTCLKLDEKRFSEFDIGTGQLVSIKDVIEKLVELTGVNKNLLVFDPSKDRGDSEINDFAKKIPEQWKPLISLEDGLRKLIDFEMSIA